MTQLGIVIPCYNEEAVFKDTLAQLSELMHDLINRKAIAQNSFLLFVNDGSSDTTWDLIEEMCIRDRQGACSICKPSRFP